MAVEDAEAPRGEHEQAGTRETGSGPAGSVDLALLAGEAGRDDRDEPGREQHAGQHERRATTSASSAATAPATRRASASSPAGAQPGVDRDERGGEHAFAEQVLQEIGDPERRVERVGRVGGAEVVREDSVANQPDEPAEEDARGHHHRRSGASGAAAAVRTGAAAGGWSGDEGSASRRWRKAFSSWSVCSRAIEVVHLGLEQLDPFGQRGHVRRRRRRALEPPGQRPADRRIHHDRPGSGIRSATSRKSAMTDMGRVYAGCDGASRASPVPRLEGAARARCSRSGP